MSGLLTCVYVFCILDHLDHRPKQHFHSQCSLGWQESGKRKLDSSATDQISAEDLTSDDKQAKRRERFLTQEQKDAEAAKEEEAKKTQERISRFQPDNVKTDDVKPDDAKKADRSQRFQQWLGPNKSALTATTANGKPKATGDKITAAVNSSLDQSAKLLGKGGKGKGASGKGPSGKGPSGKAASSKAPADVKFSDEFQAKADVSLLSCSYLLLFSICRTCDLLLHVWCICICLHKHVQRVSSHVRSYPLCPVQCVQHAVLYSQDSRRCIIELHMTDMYKHPSDRCDSSRIGDCCNASFAGQKGAFCCQGVNDIRSTVLVSVNYFTFTDVV